MEVSKANKKRNWKSIIKKLKKPIIEEKSQLTTISDQHEDHELASDNDLLENKYKNLLKLNNNNLKKQEDTQIKNHEIERELKIIRLLNEANLGDSNRLISIRNYLLAGQPLINDDDIYLKEQSKKLTLRYEDQLESNYEHKVITVKHPLKCQTILIDDIEQKPTHDFNSLGSTIANIVHNSNPHFTIGIYGEWGTGKTTLMNSIEKHLLEKGLFEKEQMILSVWFNAWKHERENSIATHSLLKTIAYAMEHHEKFNDVSQAILSALTIYDKELMQQLILNMISQKGNELQEQIDEKMSYLQKLYRNSVYFDGLEKIKQQMKNIRETDRNKDYRVIIFIDDLDRCSPNKALEVLESIKLFLDMEGFVFIIGLSHKTVTQLISHAYKSTGVKGEDYIKKIIQIPIKIPSWSHENIIDLIETRIAPKLNPEYTKFLHQNSGMIARVVDYNPRQLKRFINNVIIAFETFVSKQNSPEITFNEIFLVKILKSEWPDFYSEFLSNEDFREIVKWMITRPREFKKYFKYLKVPTDEFPQEQRNKRLLLLKKLTQRTKERINSQHVDILADFDNEMWEFFDNVQDVLYGIKDWKVIDNVMDVVEEMPYDLPIGTNKPKSNEETIEN